MTNTSATPESYSPDFDFLGGIGFCYTLGGVGGSVFHFCKAFRHSPNGQRFINGIHGVRLNAPRTAAAFAFWAGCFHNSVEYAIGYSRQKDDAWNEITAGVLTGMLYRMRQGFRPACKMGARFGAFFCLINGLEIILEKKHKCLQQELALTAFKEQQDEVRRKSLDAKPSPAALREIERLL